LGSGSRTVAITSIASSLLMHSLVFSLPEFLRDAQDFGSGLPLCSRPLNASTLLIDSLSSLLTASS
jgi:hypothetical protein